MQQISVLKGLRKHLGVSGSHYVAVAGGRASLPCGVPIAEANISLILWYKGDSGVPVYTVDARKGALKGARHFPAASLKGRTRFQLAHPRPALDIDPVTEEDADEYKCRVDYRRSRTVTRTLTLAVIGQLLCTLLC
ncbi:hypothetical protein LAZ67_4000065 [Cordylochernes scorpioides]|uniref:Ig-like domain-containing protein n=1 Tax=Cordylochernes scorpioides TaxID=51811 RepID=A0ABY6KE88_9ARAC|nr:hypothetical protein LAZ67_4000065 [Cordylochernes scorpioides]